MHSLYKQGDLPYLNVKLCPNCNELVPLDDIVCSNCTYNFNTKELEKKSKNDNEKYSDINEYVKDHEINKNKYVETKKIEEKVDEFEAEQTLLASSQNEQTIYCDKCGSKINLSQKYCGGCGTKINKKVCPYCHQIIDSSLSFCVFCGEKLSQDEIKNIEKSDEDVNELKITNQENIVESEDKVEESATPTLTNTSENFEINMGRKRFFLILQILVTLLIGCIMVLFPLLSKKAFFLSFPDVIAQNVEDTISFKSLITFVIDCIKNKQFDILQIQNLLSGENSTYIFVTYPFIHGLIALFQNETLEIWVSFGMVCFFYLWMVISLLILLISSICGFKKKKPLKGKALCNLLICITFGVLAFYLNNLTASFLGYDSWVLYAFILIFILWFIIKIVSIKEVRLYKKSLKRNQN